MSDELSATDRHALEQAGLVLSQGGVVAFPTETYYGLAVDPFNDQALARLFQLKQRPAQKPVLVLIDRPERLPLLAASVPDQYRPLISHFWPGPLTLIFPALPSLPPTLTAGTGTIGVRISSHPLARCLTAMAGGTITATSANLSGLSPATTPREVAAQFGPGLDFLLPAGPTRGGVASTIVAPCHAGVMLLREGAIPLAEVEKAGGLVFSGQRTADCG